MNHPFFVFLVVRKSFSQNPPLYMRSAVLPLQLLLAGEGSRFTRPRDRQTARRRFCNPAAAAARTHLLEGGDHVLPLGCRGSPPSLPLAGPVAGARRR